MEETGGASAYGVSLAGKGFDFYKFVREPQTVVRLLSWVSPHARARARCTVRVLTSGSAAPVQIRLF